MRSGNQWKKNVSVLLTSNSSAMMWVLSVDLDAIKQWDSLNPCCWLLCGFGLTHLLVMDWEIGEGHMDINEVWESVKEKCECLTYQLIFCNCVSVVGWPGCDQIMRLTESLLLIVVWCWFNKFGGDGSRNWRRSYGCKWGLGISERKMWVSYLPVTLLQLCECCRLIWMRSNNETYRIPVVDCCVVLV